MTTIEKKEQNWEKEFDKLELFDLETGSGKWDRKLALDFIHSNFIEKKRVEEAIEIIGKREFAHTPVKGDKEHLSHPDICSGCQAQMQFLEALFSLRKELLEDNTKL